MDETRFPNSGSTPSGSTWYFVECARIQRDLQAGISLCAANNAFVWVLFFSLLVFSCSLRLRGRTFIAQKGDFHQNSWGTEEDPDLVINVIRTAARAIQGA